MTDNEQIIGFLFALAVVPVACFTQTARRVNEIKRFKRIASAATGTVTANEQCYVRTRGGRSVIYFPHVHFVADDGTPHEFRSPVGREGHLYPIYDVGHTLPVLYDPARPEDARIQATLYDNVWGDAILGGVWTFFLLIFGGLTVSLLFSALPHTAK